MIGEYNIGAMLVLALETATREGSVAVWDHGQCHAPASADPARTHAERLPGELLDALAVAGRTLADVDVFAVVSGPGSFTGLRVGIAAVQGLALATGRPVVAVPTLEALAAPLLRRAPEDTLVVACLDGQRGEVFLAAYEAEPGGPETVIEPLSATPAHAVERLRGCVRGRRVRLVGNGALRYAAAFEALGDVSISAPAEALAAAAARMAAGDPGRAVPPHALRPIYLRRPDAVLARARARARPQPTEPAYVIRKASGTDDLSAVADLQRATFTNAWGADAIRWELEHTDVARLYVLQAPGGALVAYCACWMVFDELHINSLAVDPAWRRRGVARRLLQHVLGEAAASGARSATLEVRRSNEAARALYEGLGFRVEGLRSGYYQEPREDALVLWHRVPTLW